MIPSELFHDFLDKNVAFKIVQRNLNGPDYEFSVPHPKDGMVMLKTKGHDPLVGQSHAILGRINALMCQRPGWDAPSLSADDVYLDTGLVIDFKIVPEPARGKQAGFPEQIQVDGTILRHYVAIACAMLVIARDLDFQLSLRTAFEVFFILDKSTGELIGLRGKLWRKRATEMMLGRP